MPLRVKIGYRLAALKRSLGALGAEVSRDGSARDIVLIVLAWFVILCIEDFTPSHDETSAIFNTIFEVQFSFEGGRMMHRA